MFSRRFLKLNYHFIAKQYLAVVSARILSMKKILSFAVIILLTRASLWAQTAQDTIVVLPVKIAPPANAEKLGTIRAGNNATETHCNYEQVLREAKDKARGMGGNVVKITELEPPAFISKCYRIKADVYSAGTFRDSVMKTITTTVGQNSVSAKHATLYIYRLKDTIMLATSYHLHLNNDSVICNVRSRSRDSVCIYTEGPLTLWAKNEEKRELKLDVKFGESYYIRCGLVKGGLRMIPVIELTDKATGEAEYRNGGKQKKDMGVKYLQEIH